MSESENVTEAAQSTPDEREDERPGPQDAAAQEADEQTEHDEEDETLPPSAVDVAPGGAAAEARSRPRES